MPEGVPFQDCTCKGQIKQVVNRVENRVNREGPSVQSGTHCLAHVGLLFVLYCYSLIRALTRELLLNLGAGTKKKHKAWVKPKSRVKTRDPYPIIQRECYNPRGRGDLRVLKDGHVAQRMQEH